eukprot:9198404-Lingulodinium_polyedra.AAC.1
MRSTTRGSARDEGRRHAGQSGSKAGSSDGQSGSKAGSVAADVADADAKAPKGRFNVKCNFLCGDDSNTLDPVPLPDGSTQLIKWGRGDKDRLPNGA